MNYQKLAQTLFRVLGIWLFAQSLSQLTVASIVIARSAQNSRSPVFESIFLPSTVGVTAMIAGGILLIALSSRLARAIAGEA